MRIFIKKYFKVRIFFFPNFKVFYIYNKEFNSSKMRIFPILLYFQFLVEFSLFYINNNLNVKEIAHILSNGNNPLL